ncbi:SGNH/GDSL hydrolase family protein [Staphylococcus haemolyticus]|uniref:SGNH/GDSL hydrolase family protein n=1 Tax=Staphylococcus haemolyticus TaxID=1283 RepID=UPI000B1F0E5A|nr:SGNH/GDSL hydrolase family protein [Staphylococcus haemolyticus]
MTIYKNKDIETNINERSVDLGNINVTLYPNDQGTASFRIYLKKEVRYSNQTILEPIDLVKAKMDPRVDLLTRDGSTFTKEPIDIIDAENGVIQYVVRPRILKHSGQIDVSITLENESTKSEVANFYFFVKEDKVTQSIGREISPETIKDIVKSVMSENLMGQLSDDYRQVLEREIKDYLKSNSYDFKFKYEDLTSQEKKEFIKVVTNEALSDFVIPDQSINTNKLTLNSVEPQTTSFLKTGKNIFRANNVTQGYSVSHTTGELIKSPYYVVSDFEPVTPSTTYVQNFADAIAFYDLNKKFISGIKKADNTKNTRSFKTPSNCYYIRTGTLKEGVDTYNYKNYQIELGDTATEYEEYYRTIDYLKPNIPNNSITSDQISNSSVSLEKLGFTKHSSNLYNNKTNTTGYYVNPTTGALSSNPTYSASDYINIKGATKVTKSNARNLYAFYDDSKNFIKTNNTNTNTVDVPSNAAYIRFSDTETSMNGQMLVIGDTLPTTFVPYKFFIPKDYIENDANDNSSVSANQESFGKEFLKTYTADFSKAMNSDYNGRAEIAILGDSWVAGGEKKQGERLTRPLRERYLKNYADGGIGFVSFANGHIGNGEVVVNLTGDWTHYDEDPKKADIALSKGLDSAMVESSTVGDSIKVQFYEDLDFYEIHTLNTGTWRYNIDGGDWVTVDATQQEVTPITLSFGKHIINIEIVSGKVTFIGSYAYKGNKGVVVHKIGNGGLRGGHMTSTDRDNYIKQLKRCRANTFGILLGTNEMAQNIPVSTYINDLKEIVSRIREAKPLASIFLIAPSGNKYDGKQLHTIEDYSNAQLNVAKDLNLGHVSLYRNLGDYATTNANGLMYTDGVHPNKDGGYAICNVVYNRLLRL